MIIGEEAKKVLDSPLRKGTSKTATYSSNILSSLNKLLDPLAQKLLTVQTFLIPLISIICSLPLLAN